MATETLTFDPGEWKLFFEHLGKGFKAHNLLRAAFATAGFKDVIQHYADEMGPTGKWEPRKASTNARYDRINEMGKERAKILKDSGKGTLAQKLATAYARGHVVRSRTVGGVARSSYRSSNKLLVLTGQMRGSLLPGNVRNLGPDSIKFYSNDPKSGAHDEGDDSKNLPARPFMWISSIGQERMAQIVLDQWLAGKA